ncbi:hypothetical protein [Dysgonomonas reticulitermitis]
MRRYKNKLFAILLSVLAVISFTSCDGYEWREAQLVRYSTITAASNGAIVENIAVNYDFVEVSGRYDRIDDIRFHGGYIDINTRDYIRGFDLRLSNSDAYLSVDVLNSVGGRLEGRQVNDFLNAVVEVVRRNGYATIYVDGTASNRASFELVFFIDIDAYVSY